MCADELCTRVRAFMNVFPSLCYSLHVGAIVVNRDADAKLLLACAVRLREKHAALRSQQLACDDLARHERNGRPAR